MVMDIFLSLVTGVISGIISGIYTGIICSKYAAIEEIRREILRVLRRVEYADGKYIRGHNPKDIEPIFFASSELLGMKQKKAGLEIRKIYNKMMEEFYQNQRGKPLTKDLIDNFQPQVRLLKISKTQLLKFW